MKERKRYQNPDIQVLSIRENSDIIQTSGETLDLLQNISGNSSAQRIVSGNTNNISGLFNTSGH